MKIYANLHTHSTHSDGSYTPRELARVAKEEGYGALALTDHDTATGGKELFDECEKLGLECIFGAEFSAPSDLLPSDGPSTESTFHITAYHFDPEYPPMKEYLRQMGVSETEHTRYWFNKAVESKRIQGVEWEEVSEHNKGVAWLCNNHVFKTMTDKGIITPEERWPLFVELFKDKPKKVIPYEFKRDGDMIKLIHDAGGIAIIAHPHNQLHLIDALCEMGIDGLEACHHILTAAESKEAEEYALSHGLYISGGSDHSGMCGTRLYKTLTKDHPLYAEPMAYGTSKEYFREIKERKLSADIRNRKC